MSYSLLVIVVTLGLAVYTYNYLVKQNWSINHIR